MYKRQVPQQIDGVYQIGTVKELIWFAALVNGTLTDGTEQNLSLIHIWESGLVRGQVPVPGFFHFTGKWELVYCEKRWRVEWLILILGVLS